MEPASLRTTEQVFLSYSHSDQTAATTLRGKLEDAGISVFKDDASLRTGDRWLERLEDALQGCSAFVVLTGRDGVRRWVRAEVEVALMLHFSPEDDARRLPILPLLIEGEARADALPRFLALFQASSWRPDEALPKALFESIRRHVVQVERRLPADVCPFLGLNAFTSEDARLFFGRRRETIEALSYLGDQQQTNPEDWRAGGAAAYCRWLQIEGNSGAGKSSLVNAGMLPMIERGALWARTGFRHWRILGPMMPGNDPLAMLAQVVDEALIADAERRKLQARESDFRQDERALAFALRSVKREETAFLLIVDQFEELFTFADVASRQKFDALLACALRDAECPLFLISTVRADFLDRFEQLPRLQTIYNSHCKRYFLPTISERGLREVIEEPARLAGLDVSEVTAAIIADALGKTGALPLVENALFTLWQSEGGSRRLSGERYRLADGIVGMLRAQADELLKRVAGEVTNGRHAALELLLHLTRINDDGRNTRQRMSREEAVRIAGAGNRELGERVVQLLSGERRAADPSATGALRLITISSEQESEPESDERDGKDGKEKGRNKRQGYVDLIHETLIRARSTDRPGTREAYWPTLYDYIEKNRDRRMLRQQLTFQAERWRKSRTFGRWWNLANWHDLWRYRRLWLDQESADGRFFFWSRCAAWTELGGLVVLIGVFGVLGEAVWWAYENKLPPYYILQKPLWLVGQGPLPEMQEIKPGSFTMGCLPERDAVEGAECTDRDAAHTVTLSKPFEIGKFEVTNREYNYYLWHQKRWGKKIASESDLTPERPDLPVTEVRWNDAQTYTKWLREKTGDERYRLPTEAEWEYAARAGSDKEAYWWGNKFMKEKANCGGDAVTPVGAYPANAWGLHDTVGNVWEWVEDWYARYPEEPAVDPSGPPEGKSRVLRGGALSSYPGRCRAANRFDLAPDHRFGNVGFRVCRGAPIEPLGAASLNTETLQR